MNTNTTTFYIKNSISNSIDKTIGILNMVKKLKIATMNSSLSHNVPHIIAKSLFFILMGSIETSIFFKKKEDSESSIYELVGTDQLGY